MSLLILSFSVASRVRDSHFWVPNSASVRKMVWQIGFRHKNFNENQPTSMSVCAYPFFIEFIREINRAALKLPTSSCSPLFKHSHKNGNFQIIANTYEIDALCTASNPDSHFSIPYSIYYISIEQICRPQITLVMLTAFQQCPKFQFNLKCCNQNVTATLNYHASCAFDLVEGKKNSLEGR